MSSRLPTTTIRSPICSLRARGGQEVDASTVDAGRVELVSVVEAQRAKRHAVVFALGNEDSARVDRCGVASPVHFYLVAENRAEAVDVDVPRIR